MSNRLIIILQYILLLKLLVVGEVNAQSLFAHKSNILDSKVHLIENKGQWEDQVEYKLKLKSGYMFLEAEGFVYNFISDEDLIKIEETHHKLPNQKKKEFNVKFHGLKFQFVDRNENCKIEGLSPYQTKYNYYQGNNKSKWATGVKSYRGIKYNQLYDGIDFYLYEKGGRLKYDLIIKPFSKPEQIKFKYIGAQSIAIEEGDLLVKTSVNSIREKKPVAFQYVNGKKVIIPCEFVLNGEQKIFFQFPKGYDYSKELIIDPELIFSTYSGSTGDNWGFTATYDDLGNAYSGGIAYNTTGTYSGYPVTTGAYQNSFAGGIRDVAISKYSSDGSSLIYATYLGGNQDDNPMSMIVNSNEELIILGNTTSPNFPVTSNAVDNVFNNGISTLSDLFVTILSPDGTALVGSTYIGGSNDDGNNSIMYFYGDEHRGEVIIDSEDQIYIASNTNSFDFPVSTNSFGNTHKGVQDGCVLKLDKTASNIIWSGYLGGNQNDQASGIAIDSLNNVYVCGVTEGSGFPTTSGVLNENYQGGFNTKGMLPSNFQGDGFITKISNDGSSIISSTFLQSDNFAFDIAYMIETDIDQNVYVYGVTEGTYPKTNGVYSNGQSAQFIHKLNANLDSTIFSSVFGGGSNAAILCPTAFMIDVCYRIYVSGWGGDLSFFGTTITNNLNNFPVSPNAIKTTTEGDDFYLAVFDKDMSGLNYATYFGGTVAGEHVDGGTSRFSPEGIVYQAVCADCGTNSVDDFPSTPNAYSTTNEANNCNAAVFKIEFAQSVVDAEINNPSKDTLLCTPSEVSLQNFSSNANTFVWNFGDGDTLYTSSIGPVTHLFDTAGVYQVMLVSSNNGECFIKRIDTAYYTVNMVNSPIAYAGEDTTVYSCDKIQLNGCCGPLYTWQPQSYFSDNQIASPILSTNNSGQYFLTVEDSNGCKSVDSIYIEVYEQPLSIPNIFTPNTDNENELFVIAGLCRTIQLSIYNRWGKLVYHSDDYRNDFDADELSDGVYYYLVDNGVESYKGWVQILR